jgi:hypothetical protein
MASTFTSRVKLNKPATGDPGWSAPLQDNYNLIDALAPVGSLAVSLHESPSVSLLVDVGAGNFVAQDGSVQSYAGITSQAIPTGTSKTLYLDGTAAWALVVGSSYPATPHVRLATVTAGATTISSIVDNRQCFMVAGLDRGGREPRAGDEHRHQDRHGDFPETRVLQQDARSPTDWRRGHRDRDLDRH